MALFLIPAGYWVFGTVTAAIGVGATLAVSDSIDEFGDAAEKVGNGVSKVAISAVVLGVAYVAWENRDTIKKLVE